MRCHARAVPGGVFLVRSDGRRLMFLACHRKLSQRKRNRKQKRALDYAQYAAVQARPATKSSRCYLENQQRLPLLKVCERLR